MAELLIYEYFSILWSIYYVISCDCRMIILAYYGQVKLTRMKIYCHTLLQVSRTFVYFLLKNYKSVFLWLDLTVTHIDLHGTDSKTSSKTQHWIVYRALLYLPIKSMPCTVFSIVFWNYSYCQFHVGVYGLLWGQVTGTLWLS